MRPTPSAPLVPAVVLSCMGAPEGDLNLVRSLGEQGVPVIVLSEYEGAPSAASRYCTQSLVVPDFSQSPEQLLAALDRLHQQLGIRPVVLPSADPDLALLESHAARVEAVARSVVIDPGLCELLSDKGRFHTLAAELDLPIPKTFVLSATNAAQDIEHIARTAQFPLIVKPSVNNAWSHPDVPVEMGRIKAEQVHDAESLRTLLRALGPVLQHTVVQEFVPGDDAEHYDVHAYVDRQGRVHGTFCGRKWRIQPPHAGSGCYVESLEVPGLEALATQILTRIGYRGVANMNFKRHAITGEFKLFEINPRVSHWHILATRSGLNVPLQAYCDAAGIPMPASPARQNGLYYVNLRADWPAFRTYRREGLWSTLGWLRSLCRPRLVRQTWQLHDLGPGWAWVRRKVRAKLG